MAASKITQEAFNTARNASQYGSPENGSIVDYETAWEDIEQVKEKVDGTESIVPPGSIGRVWLTGAAYTWVGANEQGDGAFGVHTDYGASFTVSEKGVVGIKAAAPVKEDLTMGSLEVSSEHSTRLRVGTNLAIEVNASGKHDEEGDMTSSKDQSSDKKDMPAFSINVSKGGLNITCENGNIAFLGKNILLSASENIQLQSTRSIQILAGYNPARESASTIGKLFGFDLPAPSGGDVVIKAGSYTLDTNKIVNNTSAKQTKVGGSNSEDLGSSQGVSSYASSGDLNLSTSGFVNIAAGQKMRIEAQNSPVNLAGIPGVPPVWAASQIHGLEISVNNKSGIVGLPTMSIRVENGDFQTNIKGQGNYSITTQTGSASIVTGETNGILTAQPGDIYFESKIGNFTAKSNLVSGLWGVTEAGLAIGVPGAPTDAIHVFNASVNGGLPGAVMRSTKGLSAILGIKQVGMGIGTTPQASKNFIAFNPTGMISTINGASTIKVDGALTTSVTGANTFNVTGANVSNVTGLIANKSQTGIQIESPGNITMSAQGDIDIIAGGGDIRMTSNAIYLN